ncbi:MAG: pyrroline-5-carboxylate reductase [Campylobacterales bacterium]|nr:pyrroline-5-carboxylate reductase [Campylobacterales bacterium]
MRTLTFIGNGAMALALAQGLKGRYHIEVAGRSPDKLDAFEAALGVTCKKQALQDCDLSGKTVLLCVKPANVQTVASAVSGQAQTLYSILAGTSLQTLSAIDAQNYIRAMPNLAASLFKSMTTLTGNATSKEEALELFGAIGATLWVESEKELDIATALSGSGPAYLALIAEALSDGAVKQGLKRADAMTLMRGLFEGFGALIQHEHPALIKDGVMSPGGTTAQGYSALEAHGTRAACIAAIEAAYKRTLA